MVKHKNKDTEFSVVVRVSIPPGDNPKSVFLDLSFEIGANIVVQDSDHKETQLECRVQDSQQRILTLNVSHLGEPEFFSLPSLFSKVQR